MTLVDVGTGTVGHAQHVRVSAAHQGEAVFLALSDDNLVDDFSVGAQVVDALDAVRSTRLGRRNLQESLAPFARDRVLLPDQRDAAPAADHRRCV